MSDSALKCRVVLQFGLWQLQLGVLPIMPVVSVSRQLFSLVLWTDILRASFSLQHPPKILNSTGSKKSLKDRTLSEFVLWYGRLEQLINLQCPLTEALSDFQGCIHVPTASSKLN